MQRPHRPGHRLGLELALELGPCTAVTLHPFASMGITGMHRMPALLTGTTGQVGSQAACLSELDPGSTGLVEDTGAVAGSADAAGLADADLKAAVRDLLDEADLRGVERLRADRSAAGSAVIAAVVSTAVAVSAAAVVSTAAAAMAAVGTDN